MFEERIAHGMRNASFFTAPIATRMPGSKGSTYPGGASSLRSGPDRRHDHGPSQVFEKDDAKRRITLKTTVKNQLGELILDGEGVVAVLK